MKPVEELLLLQLFYYCLLQKRKTTEPNGTKMVAKNGYAVAYDVNERTTRRFKLLAQLHENGQDCIYVITTIGDT
ncbi:hypothetical protein PR048_018726 [Dryococelus australis]|uniref:Uncharacterized protein n=1 Tax=Dryococelus australis TaxID=614101 RepID=A0ABQ9HD53_9NEOP|nr:hypothetical protein PR048_018726 [Dryococelus australis]